MKTLKKGMKNIISNNFEKIIKKYSQRDCVKIALYCAEDCLHLTHFQEAKTCVDLIKKWLDDENSVTKKELKDSADIVQIAVVESNVDFDEECNYIDAALAVHYAGLAGYFPDDPLDTVFASDYAATAFGKDKKSKLEEYRNYARLFAYEDLSFPHRDFAKTFNLDDNDDLNIFLDFLTDNYPTAITYEREEYFTKRLPREYLRILYQ